MDIVEQEISRDDKREHFARWVGSVVMYHQELVLLTKLANFRLTAALNNPELLLSERSHPQYLYEKEKSLGRLSTNDRLRVFAGEALSHNHAVSFNKVESDDARIREFGYVLEALEETIFSEFYFVSSGELLNGIDRDSSIYREFAQNLGISHANGGGLAGAFTAPLLAENKIRNRVVHSIYNPSPHISENEIISLRSAEEKKPREYAYQYEMVARTASDGDFLRITDCQAELVRLMINFCDLIEYGLEQILDKSERKKLALIIRSLNSEAKKLKQGFEKTTSQTGDPERILPLNVEMFSSFHLEPDWPEDSDF